MRHVLAMTAVAALAVSTGVADAHPVLLWASPAADATVATPTRVALRFSETLIPAFSKADLTMAATSARPATTIAATVAVARDGRTLVVTPRGSLRPGRYGVAWRVVSADTHKVAGRHAFTVR